jgi:hypothetical protein
MESLLATLSAWWGGTTAWLQVSTGLSIKDLALFAGATVIVIAVLLLGIYSGKPRYREAARVGWCLLFFGAAIVAWGLYNHDMRG